jgi:hypothetical protein
MMTWLEFVILICWSVLAAAIGTAFIKLVVQLIT